jgi:hypothetical protein
MKTSNKKKLQTIRKSRYLNVVDFLRCDTCNIRGVCPEFKKGARCRLGKRVQGDRIEGGLDPADIINDQILKLYDEVIRLQLADDSLKAKEVLNKMVTQIGHLAQSKFKIENTPRIDIDVHHDIFDLIKEADELFEKPSKDKQET